MRLILKVTKEEHDKIEELLPPVWRFVTPLEEGLLLPLRGVNMDDWPLLEIKRDE